MKKILYVNGNPQKEDLSFSRRAGKYYLEQINKSDEGYDVEVVNVYDNQIQLIDEDVLEAWGLLRSGTDFSELSKPQQNKVSKMNQTLEQFKSADEYVFVTPLWNFGIPPMLKAYIDNIMIAGETFKYTENGPVGLMLGKKATIIQASGGVYSDGPAKAMEHGTNYLSTTLNFLGVEDVKTFFVEGVALPDNTPEALLSNLQNQVDEFMKVN